MLHPRNKIAHRRKAQTSDHRVLHDIDQLINLARHEARIQRARNGRWRELSIFTYAQSSTRARNHARAPCGVSRTVSTLRASSGRHRDIRPAKPRAHDVAQRHLCWQLPSGVKSSRSRPVICSSAGVISDRRVEAQIARGDIPLPAERAKVNPCLQQPSIAQVGAFCRDRLCRHRPATACPCRRDWESPAGARHCLREGRSRKGPPKTPPRRPHFCGALSRSTMGAIVRILWADREVHARLLFISQGSRRIDFGSAIVIVRESTSTRQRAPGLQRQRPSREVRVRRLVMMPEDTREAVSSCPKYTEAAAGRIQ
jgi:hypothetical protein